MKKTLGALHKEIDKNDIGFVFFCEGWNAAVEQSRRGGVDSSYFSDAQLAQCWGIYTEQL